MEGKLQFLIPLAACIMIVGIIIKAYIFYQSILLSKEQLFDKHENEILLEIENLEKRADEIDKKRKQRTATLSRPPILSCNTKGTLNQKSSVLKQVG